MSCRTVDVRERILNAACELFARRGYRDATIASICHRAGANIASVNYYFGSKENLYVEAWKLSFERSVEAHPLDGGVPPWAPVEERLLGVIRSFVERITDPENQEFEIVQKELANPTGLLVQVIHDSIRPIEEMMDSIVGELLGRSANHRTVKLCRMSILAQCIHAAIHERRKKELQRAGRPFVLTQQDITIGEWVEHIYRFSLAAIRQFRMYGDNKGP